MGFKGMLNSLMGGGAAKKPASQSGVISLGDRHPVAEYLDMLVRALADDASRNVVLRAGFPLPAAPGASAEALHSSFTELTNRLKVLCGFDPIAMKAPTQGSFETSVRGRRYVVNVHFNDVASPPQTRISLPHEK